MKNQPASVKVNDYLCWESARLDDFLADLDCEPPQPTQNFLPEWYANLKGDLRSYRTDDWRYNHTVRYCKGLQGLHSIGWTMPLPIDITAEQNVISRKIVVPEMLYGTMWNEKDQNNQHVWDFTIVFWPWRARLAKGWKMFTTAYHLDWNPDWFEFSGLPPANYSVNLEKNSIGSMYQWEQALDTDTYDYYNIETVLAFRRGTTIKKGAITFSLILIPPATF
jgi:hypothetical protein